MELPRPKKILKLGQELVTSLTSQIYQLYDMAKEVSRRPEKTTVT